MSDIIPLPAKIPLDETSQKFVDWLENSKYGDKYCYHIGVHLSNQKVARVAFKAFEKGSVTLFQKRNGKEFEYWAVRKRV